MEEMMAFSKYYDYIYFFICPKPKGSEKVKIIPIANNSSNIKKKSILSFFSNIFNWAPYRDGAKPIENVVFNSISLLITLLFLISCQKEPVETIYFDFSGKTGLYVLNEGNFMYGNASLTFYDAAENRTYQQIFSSRNKAPLGDVAQSMNTYNSMIWMVINNSGKIYIADENTLEFKGSITALNSPRYLEFINNNKAYVSDLYDESIQIINPNTFEKTGAIDLRGGNHQRSGEQMIQKGDTIFTNCWNNGNEILLINSQSDELMSSLTVGAQPQSMALDKNQKLWVICDGGFDGHPYFWERPELIRIDTRTMEIEKKFLFDIETSPSELRIQNDTLYYINRNIYRMSIHDHQLPPQAFIESPYSDDYGGFYTLAIDPRTTDIYVADAIDHQQNGIIYQYNLNGELMNSFKAGVNPGYINFKANY